MRDTKINIQHAQITLAPLGLTVTVDAAYVIKQMILRTENLDVYDDAGCDWYTEGNTTYIQDTDWVFSSNPVTARLVDAWNALKYGHALHLVNDNPPSDTLEN